MGVILKHVLLIFFLLYYTRNISAAQNKDEGAINISLSNYKPLNQSAQVFGSKHDIFGQYIISITDVPIEYTDFFIIQVHSFSQNVSLSYDKKYSLGSHINGTNIGLIQLIKGATSYKFYLNNEKNTTVYIAILPYNTYKQAPIPGGCNMEFATEYAPYQMLTYTDSVITVDAAPASFKNHRCESQVVKHELYQLYLPLRTGMQDAYFEGVQSMLTVENITKYATKVSNPLTGILRQLYNVYKGTGSVYVVVGTVNGSSSAYVPIVSYGCDINNPESCEYYTSWEFLYLCGWIVFFLGCFFTFYGHVYFRSEMFLFGTLSGGYTTFILLSLIADMSETGMIWSSIGVGLLYGVVWLRVWCHFGIPIVSTMLPLFVLGYLFACIAFYYGLNDLTIFNNDITFWGFFFSIVLLSVTILMGCLVKANILACAIVGSFMIIIPTDYYYYSNLKYIFINIYRHMSVENYRLAVINAPFQNIDLILVLSWLFIMVIGALVQNKNQEGRSPFPPTSPHPPNERTPLLIPTSSRSNRLILGSSRPDF